MEAQAGKRKDAASFIASQSKKVKVSGQDNEPEKEPAALTPTTAANRTGRLVKQCWPPLLCSCFTLSEVSALCAQLTDPEVYQDDS